MKSAIRHTASAIVLSLLTVTAAQAQNTMPAHQARLQELQKKVSVSVEPGLSFFEQVQAVQLAYNVIVDSEAAQFYGPDRLVQSIIIHKPYLPDATDDSEAQALAKLRGHLLYFSTDGKTAEIFERNVDAEMNTLAEIARHEASLSAHFPQLKLERTGDYVTGVLTTNESYLEVLNNLEHAAESRTVSDRLDTLFQIQFKDSGDHIGGFHIERGQMWGHPEEPILFVTIGRPWTSTAHMTLHPDFMLQALSIVLSMGFQKLSSELLELEETPAALQALYAKLTPEIAEKLKAQGIQGFNFSSSWNRQDNMIERGMLLLGSKAEDINAVIDFYAGNTATR